MKIVFEMPEDALLLGFVEDRQKCFVPGNLALSEIALEAHIKPIIMKAKDFLLIAMLMLSGVSTAFAGEKKVEGKIFDTAECPPYYWGTEHYGVPRFMSNHFKYPREAWAVEQHRTVRVVCVICKDGSVKFESCDEVEHPALLNEIRRVVEKMHWIPAMRNGSRVNLRYSLYLPLCQPGYMGNTAVPYGFESYVKTAEKMARKMGDSHVAYDPATLADADSILADAAMLFPQRPLSSVAYSRLQSSMGRDSAAIATIDYCLITYNPYRFVHRDTVITHPSSPDYSGRRELGIAVMRAVQHAFHRSDATGAAIVLANRLVGDRMADGRIADGMSGQELMEADLNMRRMMRDQVNELFIEPLVADNSPINEKHGLLTTGELSSWVSYWSEKGEDYNAQTSQLTNLIARQEDEMWFGKMAKGDMQNLLGVKAFLYWLVDGNEGVEKYVDKVRNSQPSKKVARYLDRLEKRLKENSELLADREGVVRSLACLVPPSGTSEADAEAFYARRRVAERVFPLRWLMK